MKLVGFTSGYGEIVYWSWFAIDGWYGEYVARFFAAKILCKKLKWVGILFAQFEIAQSEALTYSPVQAALAEFWCY